MGDLTFWLDQSSSNSYCSNFVSLLQSSGLCAPVTSLTHLSGHSLDLLLFPSSVLSSDLTPPNVTVLPPDPSISHHSLLTFFLPFFHTSPPPSLASRDFRKFKADLFSFLVSNSFPLFLSLSASMKFIHLFLIFLPPSLMKFFLSASHLPVAVSPPGSTTICSLSVLSAIVDDSGSVPSFTHPGSFSVLLTLSMCLCLLLLNFILFLPIPKHFGPLSIPSPV